MTHLCSLSPPCIASTRQEGPGWGVGDRGRAVPVAAGRWWRNCTLGQEFSPPCIVGPISKPSVWAKLVAGAVCRPGVAEKMYLLAGGRSLGRGRYSVLRSGRDSRIRIHVVSGITQALGLERRPRGCSSKWPTSPVLRKVTLLFALSPSELRLGPRGQHDFGRSGPSSTDGERFGWGRLHPEKPGWAGSLGAGPVPGLTDEPAVGHWVL